MILARLMRFYLGLTVADYDAMGSDRLESLIEVMNKTPRSGNA